MGNDESNWLNCSSLLREIYDGSEDDLSLIELQPRDEPKPNSDTSKQSEERATEKPHVIRSLSLEALSPAELVAMADAIVPQVPALTAHGR
jgi:hypothetical protein